MKLDFLSLPTAERQLYIEQAASLRNISPVIIEKDFWVSWLLGVVFTSEFAEHLVFKGGTSLSKVFGVIHRFSEDIDLSLSPQFLKLPTPGTSRTQAAKWMTSAEAAAGDAVRLQVSPVLEQVATRVLGPPAVTWFEYQHDATTNSPVLLFHYPSLQPPGFEYLKRVVKLELGSLTDQQPVGRHPIRPLIAEALPQAFSDWRADVVALDLERTFWEKATILHAEYHRPPDKVLPDRFSRHYADTAALAAHPIASSAIANSDLCNRVVQWKAQFFGVAWANYASAQPGSIRLVPHEDRVQSLRHDYHAMRDMYLHEPPSFDTILETLSSLESRINYREPTRAITPPMPSSDAPSRSKTRQPEIEP